MKIAFHFNADEKALGWNYGEPIRDAFFRAVLSYQGESLHTLISQDDLLLSAKTMDRISIAKGCDYFYFNEERFQSAIRSLLDTTNIWSAHVETIKGKVKNGNAYVVCLENISLRSACQINNQLCEYPWYLGALQVDDGRPIHRAMYVNAMTPYYRLEGRDLRILWDVLVHGESPNFDYADQLRRIGFESVTFEPFNFEHFSLG